MAALDVRFMDRFFDLHVMNAMQLAVDGALTGDPVKRADGLSLAVDKLERAYAWLEGELAGKTWAYCLEFRSTTGAPARLSDRIWTPLAENRRMLHDSRMGSLMYVLAIDTARAYG